MLWRRLRIALSFSLNFSFCQNEKPFSFDQNENNATFTENLKLFKWFKMFHSSIEDCLIQKKNRFSSVKKTYTTIFKELLLIDGGTPLIIR
jgi:hypothetical protein